MREIIYYGAGANLRDFEEDFVRETGYPMYICDLSQAKQGKKYTFTRGGCRKVVSLDYVKSEYPDYEWLQDCRRWRLVGFSDRVHQQA